MAADPHPTVFMTGKIRSVRELASEFASSTSRPPTVVQCHGVFDLLHIGHIRHLQQARQLGDCLVVTITPDRFVNKGPHRPAFTEELRAESLAALACVDFVCINEWPTAVEALEMIRPDIFLKGCVRGDGPRDRNGAIDLEREAIQAVGGRLVLTDTELHSASALINRHTEVLAPRLKAFLAQFREEQSAAGLAAEIAKFDDMRVLVIGESHVDAGGQSAGERSSERYAGGALAVANALSDFCDQVALVTVGLGDEASDGFLRKNVAAGIECEIPSADRPVPAAIELSLERLLDRSDAVLLSGGSSWFLSPRALSMIAERSQFLAVDARSRNTEVCTRWYPHGADLVVLQERDARAALREGNGSQSPQGKSDVACCAKRIAQQSECTRVLMVQQDEGVGVYDAGEDSWVEVPPLPVNEVNRKDLLGTREALFALVAPCSARRFSGHATGLVGSVAHAAASTLVGSGHKLDATSIFRHIDSLLK